MVALFWHHLCTRFSPLATRRRVISRTRQGLWGKAAFFIGLTGTVSLTVTVDSFSHIYIENPSLENKAQKLLKNWGTQNDGDASCLPESQHRNIVPCYQHTSRRQHQHCPLPFWRFISCSGTCSKNIPIYCINRANSKTPQGLKLILRYKRNLCCQTSNTWHNNH